MSYQELWHRLAQTYDEGEAKAIARMVYEVKYGLTWSDLLMGRDSTTAHNELEEIARRLEHHEPVQYVLGKTDFCGHTFIVNKHVLIPRPETEELCLWKPDFQSATDTPVRILDIGTGSGCIAITLASMYPQAEVSAWDISEEALTVARENAKLNAVDIHFQQVDMLNLPPSSMSIYAEDESQQFSLIISNPPYILNKERESMEANVLDYEPHTALFVPDKDPLLFYRAIAQFGLQSLKAGGWLYFEINPLYATELKDMLRAIGYQDIEIKKDEYGKQRMIRARR